MSKLFIEDSTLTAIGDAIREKTGKTDLIAPGSMPAEIKAIVSGGGGEGDCNGLHITEEGLIVKGKCNYRFAENGWNWFIEEGGNRITTNSISDASFMFSNSTKLTEIPFSINFCDTTINAQATNQMFWNCGVLEKIPEIKGLYVYDISNMFAFCFQLKEFPSRFGNDWNWEKYLALNQYNGKASSLFNNCHRLRAIPSVFLTQEHIDKVLTNSNSLYYSGFDYCYSLEKINNLPVYTHTTWTSNAFYNTFRNCGRLKELTFAVQADGTPYVAPWTKQTIDLTQTGYEPFLKSYAPEFTDATKITTSEQRYEYCEASIPPDEGYEKDGWADEAGWSVFGRRAAKRLFATLPDTSAAGGGNTIKFKSNAAIKAGTDAISALTEEEIAVATAKGWTVSLV